MDQEKLNENKKNLIGKLMQRQFESSMINLLYSEKSIQAMDRKLDPAIREYFTELGALCAYYEPDSIDDAEKNDPGEGPTEYNIKCQKCALLVNLMQVQFEDNMLEMLRNTNDISEVDKKLEDYMKKFWANEKKVYEFYGIEYTYEDDEIDI